MDNDARLQSDGRLPYLPALTSAEAKLGHGLLDHEIDAYLSAGENPEDYEEYTINEMGVLPEDRPRRRIVSKDLGSSASSGKKENRPRRRVISKGPSSSSSSGKVFTYSSRSFNTPQASAPSQSIMSSFANYAHDRSLRSTRKVSNKSISSDSTNISSTSSASVMTNCMPIPGSIRMPIYGKQSDSEEIEGESDGGEERDLDRDHDDEEGDEEHEHMGVQEPLHRYHGHYQVIQNSDDEDEAADEDEGKEEDEFSVKPISRSKGLRDATDSLHSDRMDNGRGVSLKSAPKLNNLSNETVDISPYVENEYEEYDDEDGFDEDEGDAEIEHEEGNTAGGDELLAYGGEEGGEEEYAEDLDGEDGYGEAVEDDEWFDESGYCKFCDLHQHECECIRGDDNDPMELGEDDDDDYKN
ncbi:hypothetical protein ONS95_011897 [Cadophora gregata]|nr:uncharacterized protein ONS95_011897 [Cadophora gregata]KAK0117560.1 hypothetical protein ONS95_011897 [Cadophora gregata]